MRIERQSTTETVITWLFLVSIAVLAINQIISESRLFDLPHYQIYRTFLIAAYLLGLALLLFHMTQRGGVVDKLLFVVLFTMMLVVISGLLNDISFNEFFVSTCWGVGFIAGYCSESKGVFGKLFKTRFLLFVVVSIFAFISMYENFSKEHGVTNIIGVNYIFYFGFPLFFWFERRNKIKYEIILSILFIVAAIFSFKRTSFIAIVLALVFYYFFKYARNNSLKMQVTVVVAVVLIVIAVQMASNYTGGRLFERFSDIKETGGNGRLEIWKETINAYKNLPFANKMLGAGFNTVKNSVRSGITGLSAHNDFLEILYDHGIVVFVLYVYIVLKVLKTIMLSQKINRRIFPLFLAVFSMFIALSFFSHVTLYSYVSLPVFYLLGSLYSATFDVNNDDKGRKHINERIGGM